MNPLVRIGLQLAVVMGCLYGAYHHGVSTTTEHYQGVIAKANQDHAEAVAKLQQQARDKERQHGEQLATIDQQHQEKLSHEINSRDRTIADLRAGNVRVRQRFTCPAASDQRVPSTSTSTSGGDEAQAGGLQREDAEFFVRFASEADEVTLQLQACQATVRSDRGQ